jgi:hypothetical protein
MAAVADARKADGIPTEASVMQPNDPRGRRAFESPFREDPAPQAPESRMRDRTHYIGKAMLAAFVLLLAIVALILLL